VNVMHSVSSGASLVGTRSLGVFEALDNRTEILEDMRGIRALDLQRALLCVV
jgi:hypothetical protein